MYMQDFRVKFILKTVLNILCIGTLSKFRQVLGALKQDIEPKPEEMLWLKIIFFIHWKLYNEKNSKSIQLGMGFSKWIFISRKILCSKNNNYSTIKHILHANNVLRFPHWSGRRAPLGGCIITLILEKRKLNIREASDLLKIPQVVSEWADVQSGTHSPNES